MTTEFMIHLAIVALFLLGPILGIWPIQTTRKNSSSGQNNLFYFSLGEVHKFTEANKSRRAVGAHELIEQWIWWFPISGLSLWLHLTQGPIAGFLSILLLGLAVRALLSGRLFDLFGHSGETAYIDDERYLDQEVRTMIEFSKSNFGKDNFDDLKKEVKRMRKFSGIFVKLATLRIKRIKESEYDLDKAPYV